MQKQHIKDQLGNMVSLIKPIRRIISTVPSQSELLFYFGLKNNMVGITEYCIQPNKITKHLTKVDGTKNLDIQKIIDLKPDILIAGKEENNKEQIEEIKQRSPVWVSNINNLDDAFSMIKN